jgi:hypothetical protein
MKITIDDNEFEVGFEYAPARRGSRDGDGIQLEPDEPEYVELNSVIFICVEVVSIICKDILGQIEEKVLERLKEDQDEG